MNPRPSHSFQRSWAIKNSAILVFVGLTLAALVDFVSIGLDLQSSSDASDVGLIIRVVLAIGLLVAATLAGLSISRDRNRQS